MTTRTDRPRRAARAPRPGMTLLELLIVLVLVALAGAMALPKLRPARERASLRGARGDVVAAIEAARGAALQRGREARVLVRLDRQLVRAVVDTGSAANPTRYQIATTPDLRQEYNRVQISLPNPADSVFTYDGRGFARTSPARTVVYLLTAPSGARDSVCVSARGLLLPPGCVP